MSIFWPLLIITLCSAAIYKAGEAFADASSMIGDHLRIPRSVKGATFDAISSSFPELMIAVFAVLSFQRFEVGIGTITGSALFNLLFIPGVAVLLCPKPAHISKEVINRDGTVYVISVLALVIALFAYPIWGLMVPLAFFLIYGAYLGFLITHAKRFRASTAEQKLALETPLSASVGMALFTMVIIAVAAYFLTEQAIELAYALEVSPVLIAFTVAAVATSIPDAVISFVNAKKGDIDDSIANAIGSNSFDILIGLGLPALLAIVLTGSAVEIPFDHSEVVIGLLISTLIFMGMLIPSHKLTKAKASVLILIYAGFIGYFVWLS